MTSPYALLDRLPDIRLVWTNDEGVLKGRDGRWFPGKGVIAIRASLRRLKRRCSLAHELGHIVLGHVEPCGVEFYDHRIELEADEFAARLLLDNLVELGDALALCSTAGHVAHELNVTADLLDTRLSTLKLIERDYLDAHVGRVNEGRGA